MALTINPAGSGSRRGWIRDVGCFFVGTFFGALASGAVAVAFVGLLTALLSDSAVALVLMLIIIVAGLKEAGLNVPLPYRAQQVPEWWRYNMPLPLASLGYGCLLGFGFATPFTAAAHLALLVALPFLSSATSIVVCLACFALGKTLVLQMGAGTTSHGDVIARISSKESNSSPRRAARMIVSLGSAMTVGAVLWTQIPQ
jgi:hypothetical protein